MKGKGYNPAFLGKHLKVPLPQLSVTRKADLAPVTGSRNMVLRYDHHSVALSRKRKFSLFTAVNIDGSAWQSIKRASLFPGGTDRWEVDARARDYQWGAELYTIEGSDFDRGHLVKREDPQWGRDAETAMNAARSTFYYANCVPQVEDLNQREWRSLEDYILKKQSARNKIRINVFTGPVLSDDDPVFMRPVNGNEVQIPALFWKMIYFTPDGENLYRVAFLMGQKELLLKRKIARLKEEELERAPAPKPPFFLDFEDSATYQVNSSFVEQLTQLSFAPANDPYVDQRPAKIVLKAVEVGTDGLERFPGSGGTEYELEGLVLR